MGQHHAHGLRRLRGVSSRRGKERASQKALRELSCPLIYYTPYMLWQVGSVETEWVTHRPY